MKSRHNVSKDCIKLPPFGDFDNSYFAICMKSIVTLLMQVKRVILFSMVLIFIIAMFFSCSPGFPVENIQVAPGKSNMCNIIDRDHEYTGTYYRGSARAVITTELPTFLYAHVKGDMAIEIGSGLRAIGHPEITINVTADLNATPGTYMVEGQWHCLQYTQRFKVNIEITKEQISILPLE